MNHIIDKEILGQFSASQWQRIRSVLLQRDDFDDVIDQMKVTGLWASINLHAYGTVPDHDFDSKPIIPDRLPMNEPDLTAFFEHFE